MTFVAKIAITNLISMDRDKKAVGLWTYLRNPKNIFPDPIRIDPRMRNLLAPSFCTYFPNKGVASMTVT